MFDIVQAVPLTDLFVTTEEADAYIDPLQRDMLQGSERGWLGGNDVGAT